MNPANGAQLEVKAFLCSRRMFQQNSYLVWCPDSREALVIDPGCVDSSETEELLGFVKVNRLALKWIVNTHGHLDHIAGNGMVQEATGAEILVHAEDAPMLPDAWLNGSMMMGINVVSPKATRTLAEGDSLILGTHEIRVLHTPGHTKGGISLVAPGFVFSGDTLFAGGVGRTDLPGGSMEVEIASIREKLFVLPSETVVFPGHGPKTTIGVEKQTNPFL